MFRYLLLTVLGVACAWIAPLNTRAQIGENSLSNADAQNETGSQVDQSVDKPAQVDQHEQYALAIGHYRRKDWNRAVISLGAISNSATTEASIRADALFFLGEAQVQLAQFDQAYKTFNSFVLRYPKHQHYTRALFRKAEAAFFANNSSNAINGFKHFVSQHPTHSLVEYALPYLGELYLNSGEIKESQQAYQKALKQFPSSTLANKCRFGLAKSYRQTGDVENAARFYRYVADQPDSLETQEASLQLGTLWFESNDFEKARAELSKVSTERSDRNIQVQAIYWIARCEMEMENWQTAVGKLRSIAASGINEPLGSAIFYDGAVAALRIDQWQTALDFLDRLNKNYPESKWNDDALELSIKIQSDQKNWSEVKIRAKEFAKRFPDSPLASRVDAHLGRSFHETGDSEAALDIFARLVDSNDQSDSSSLTYWLYWKSVCEIELKRFDEARTSLEKIAENKTTPDLLPYVLLAKATTYQAGKNWDLASKALNSFLQDYSSHSEAAQCRIELAVVSARMNQWPQANQNWQAWLQANPANDKKIQAAELLGELAYQAQNYDLARQWFNVLVADHNPEDVIARGQTQLTWLDAAQKNSSESAATIDWSKIENSDSMLNALLAKAESFQNSGSVEQAHEIYQQVNTRFAKTDQAAIAAFKLASIQINDDQAIDYAASIELLKTLIEDDRAADFRDKVLYELAWAHKKSNQTIAARQVYQRIVKECPESEYWSDSLFRLAKMEFDSKQFEQAKELINVLLKNASKDKNRQMTFMLQFDVAIAESNIENAASIVEEMSAEFPDADNTAKLYFTFGEYLFTKNHPVPALASFKHYLDHPKSDGYKVQLAKLRIAQCYGYQDKWEKAAEISTKAIREYPRFQKKYEHYVVIGRYYASIAEFEKARESYNRVVNSYSGKKTKSAAMAQWLIGETYFHQQNYADAIEAYYKVDSLYDYPNWRAAALLQAGKCHEKLEQWAHAARLYRQVVDEHPATEYAKRAAERLEVINRRTTKNPQNIR